MEGKNMTLIERDSLVISSILEKGQNNITDIDKVQALQILQMNYHDSGKIEGCFSCDSSCHGCEFCQNMREKGKNNPLLICNYCYDNEQENRWENVKKRHELNLLILSSIEFSVELFKTHPVLGILRENSSGDVENLVHAKNLIYIAYANPSTCVGLWSKNVKVVNKAFSILGKPNNMVFVQSSPIIGHSAKRSQYADYLFTVYATEDDLQNALASGAMECNGKKCKECGYKCYFRQWPIGCNIAELLRLKNKKAMQAIQNALNKGM